MVPASDEPLFTAKVEAQPMPFNSIPKLVCIVQQSTLIPAGLPLVDQLRMLTRSRGTMMRFSARRFWRPSETALLHQGESTIRAEKLCGWDLFWQIWLSRAPLFSQSLLGNLKCSQPESWTKAWGPWTSWWQVLGNVWIHFSPLLLIFKVLPSSG